MADNAAIPSSAPSKSAANEPLAPHPGAQDMPRWDLKELVEPPRFTLRAFAAMLGPGIVMAGSAIGAGEWLTGPLVTARYGGGLLWLATMSILFQVVYNLEISRYTLYTGEPIFTGKFRTLPGPRFWLWVYILLDAGSVFPYLASSAATPVFYFIMGRLPDTNSKDLFEGPLGLMFTDAKMLTAMGCVVFVLAMIPLTLGGKIYNSLRWVMSVKIVVVFSFLLVLAFFFSKPATWVEIFSGFVKFGNVPILRGEDTNGNGKLDPGEDWDGDGHLDGVEERVIKKEKSSLWDSGNFEDIDGDGRFDGDKTDNIFVSLAEGRGFPKINLAMIALLCAMVAISGQGGLSNTPLSNYTRDQGWGMGRHVGAIPSVVGGHNLQLSHVGAVFAVTPESLVRWRGWFRHVLRDQVCVWAPACFVGLALPSMLSVQFLKRGTEAANWTAAGMTAQGVADEVANSAGASLGAVFHFLTLFCGLLVLAPTSASSADGVIRRWVDVFWTASPRLRQADTRKVGKLYFMALCGYVFLGLLLFRFVDGNFVMPIATNIFNYAIGFSCWHVIFVNWRLLPKAIQPGWFTRVMLFLGGLFFLTIAGLATYAELAKRGFI